MAFWKYNLVTQSHIDTLLEKEDVTLEEILNEGDLLQEVRTHAPKLINYIKKTETLEQLVELIITDPDPNVDYKLQYKLPNAACEVLTFDIPVINDALVSNPHLLTRVCNVFRQEDSLNDLTASFVCKLLILLATKRTESFLEFIQYYDPERYIRQNKGEDTSKESSQEEEKQDDEKPLENGDQKTEEASSPDKEDNRVTNSLFVDMLLNHVNNSAIKDLINRMVECSDNPELRPKVVEWLSSAQLVTKLVAMLSPDNSEQVITNCAKCICKVIKIGREQQMVLQEKCPPDPLLEAAESTEIVAEILKHSLPEKQEEVSCWTLCESMFILMALLKYRKTTPSITELLLDAQCFAGVYNSASDASPNLGELDEKRAKESISKCLAAVNPRLEAFLEHLTKPVGLISLATTADEPNPCFGAVRLEIVRLISAIVSTSEESSHQALLDLKALPIVLDLFFAYPLCSQLHNQVESIVKAICTPPKATTPTGDEEPPTPPKHALFDQLFNECNVIDKILNHYTTVPREQKGYNGHLRLIANHVEKMGESAFSSYYSQMLEGLPKEGLLQSRWLTFCKETLATVNKAYASSVEPMHTAPSCSEDDEVADLRDMGLPTHDAIAAAQQAYVDYQMNQVTASFIDQFGFKDDEFTDVDIPGIAEVTTPRMEDHSSDEEETEEVANGKPANAEDPWSKMDQPFNPWNLAGSAAGDGEAAGQTDDAWADFGTFKGAIDGATAASDSKADADVPDNWADFEAFKSAADGRKNEAKLFPGAAAKEKADNNSDEEF